MTKISQSLLETITLEHSTLRYSVLIEAFKFFDAYSLRARVFPALIISAPLLLLITVLVSWSTFGLPQAVAVVMSCVLLFAFADIARLRGRQVEIRLGTRATLELLFRNNPTFDQVSKDRYRNFLAKQIGEKAPPACDEINILITAKVFYDGAFNWLREHTRDTKKFAVLFDELITYGFRRNLLGLKWISLALNGVVILISLCGYLLLLPYLRQIEGSSQKFLGVIIVALLHSLYLIFAVNDASVVEASKTYGRQLLLSCETLMSVGHVSPIRPK